jgi:hypothetical protein
MPPLGGYWDTLGHWNKGFCAFAPYAPYEKFICLDGDMLCTSSFNGLIERLRKSDRNSLFATIFTQDDLWRKIIENESHPQHKKAKDWVRRGLGNVENMHRFDSAFDPYAICPISSGIYASTRGAIPEKAIMDLFEREKRFYSNVLKSTFEYRKNETQIFYGDQGRLVYLIDRMKIKLYNTQPDGSQVWAGNYKVRNVPVGEALANQLTYSFIHLGGELRLSPSIFSKGLLHWVKSRTMREFKNKLAHVKYIREMPGYSLWKHYSDHTWFDTVLWTWRDIRLIFRRVFGYLARSPKKLIGRLTPRRI